MSDKWNGTEARQARAYWLPRVMAGDCECLHCGEGIGPGQTWDVDHVEPLALGGEVGRSNQAPAHSTCNRRAGQRIAQTNMRTRKARAVRMRRW